METQPFPEEAGQFERQPKARHIDRNDQSLLALLDGAPIYRKMAAIQARPAVPGEPVQTVLHDGAIETTNVATEGDMVVTNPGGEMYIVAADVFDQRYTASPDQSGVFLAKGTCKVIQNPYQQPIVMEAEWGELQYGDEECLLAVPYDTATGQKSGDPYIIAKSAFEQTYRIN